MHFRLVYRGQLRSGNSKNRSHIHEIRRHFHRQIHQLWNQIPLSEHGRWLKPPDIPGNYSVLYPVGDKSFAALVGPHTDLMAELDILFLRPAPPGALINHGGDLDNRIKTLIDALRIPTAGEIPPDWQPSQDEVPLHCLLQDDKLVTAFSVRADRLLEESASDLDALVVVHVRVTALKVTMGNSSLLG
jgi:hypothetical protein